MSEGGDNPIRAPLFPSSPSFSASLTLSHSRSLWAWVDSLTPFHRLTAPLPSPVGPDNLRLMRKKMSRPKPTGDGEGAGFVPHLVLIWRGFGVNIWRGFFTFFSRWGLPSGRLACLGLGRVSGVFLISIVMTFLPTSLSHLRWHFATPSSHDEMRILARLRLQLCKASTVWYIDYHTCVQQNT